MQALPQHAFSTHTGALLLLRRPAPPTCATCAAQAGARKSCSCTEPSSWKWAATRPQLASSRYDAFTNPPSCDSSSGPRPPPGAPPAQTGSSGGAGGQAG